MPTPLRQFLGSLDDRPHVRNQLLLGGLSPARHHPLLAADVREALAAFDPYVDIDRVVAECPEGDAVGRMIYRYCRHYLAGQNLANADRASMAIALELRAPFLDHRFVELTGRIPSRLKLRGLWGLKRLLKTAPAERLPPEIRRRGKHGFTVPFATWMRGELADPLRDGLAAPRLRAGGLLDPDAVTRLIEEHVQGKRDHARVLWSALVLELWRTAHGVGRG